MEIKQEAVDDIYEEKMKIEYENWNDPNCSLVANVKPEIRDELNTDSLTTRYCEEVQYAKMQTSNFIRIKKEQDHQYLIKNEQLHETCDLPSIKSEADIAAPFKQQLYKAENSQTKLGNCNKSIRKKRRYACPVCLKNVLWSRNRHRKIPSESHQYIVTCHFCGKFFIDKKEFSIHMVNYRINNYVQALNPVPKPTKSIPTRLTHDLNLRTHTGDKPFECEICYKCFGQKTTLSNHVRIHTGEKPFKCEICYKCFSQETTLSNHVRIHTGEKPFTCEICLKCFNHSSTLTRHMRTHTSDRPFKCGSSRKAHNSSSVHSY